MDSLAAVLLSALSLVIDFLDAEDFLEADSLAVDLWESFGSDSLAVDLCDIFGSDSLVVDLLGSLVVDFLEEDSLAADLSAVKLLV